MASDLLDNSMPKLSDQTCEVVVCIKMYGFRESDEKVRL